jgi:NadR type nicotinamide-nucleotide adenylyltransferase
VRASLAARVVILGAESTGSTTLAQALAADLGTTWVPEYGREYSATRPGGFEAPWTSPEFELIVEAQFALERQALRCTPTPILVCDTDVLATALWHERYVGERTERILAKAAEHQPALYILSGDEIPFVQDGLRDGEHIRHSMQSRFREELDRTGLQWIEVRGSVPDRVTAAREAIDSVVVPSLHLAPPLG